MSKRILVPNFWPKSEWNNKTELTEDEIGWTSDMRIGPGSDDTKDVFDYWIKHLGFDLGLYYVEDDTFYLPILTGMGNI